MKKLICTILLGLFGYPVVMAQFSDENTETINQYFQVNLNQPVRGKIASPKTDPKMGSYVEIVQTGRENSININCFKFRV